MIDYKFLEKGSAREQNRPMLTWGMGCELDGRNVLYSADGYRLHLSWRGPQDRVIPFFPFPHSSDDYEPTTPIDINKDGDGVVASSKPLVEFSFADHESLRATLKAAKAFGKFAFIAVNSSGVPELMVTNERGKHARFDLDCPPAKMGEESAFYVGFDLVFLMDALEAKFNPDWPITIGLRPEYPARVGQWGIVAAIIMPVKLAEEKVPELFRQKAEAF